MRYLPHIVCLLLALALGAALLLIFQYAGNLPRPSGDLPYADFISIMLTALGVMLTALTIFLGVLAILGWSSIETKLRDHSINYVKDELSSNGKLRTELEELFTEIAYQGVESYKAQKDTKKEEKEYHD